jgi:hypothetical protein
VGKSARIIQQKSAKVSKKVSKKKIQQISEKFSKKSFSKKTVSKFFFCQQKSAKNSAIASE